MTIDNTFAMQIIMVAFSAFLIIEIFSGEYKNKEIWSMKELGINILSFLNFQGVRVLLLVVVSWLLYTLFPAGEGFMADWPFWPVFMCYLLVEEYIHYWVHRLAHEIPWLWRFHKPHHTANVVNLTVTARENWIWFLLVPNAWLGALLVWGGQMEAAMIGMAIKGCSEWMVHSSVRWDLALQKNRISRPLMWVLERIITLPDTHHVHHGLGKYGNAMGNYGSFLFVFDVLHGTGTIPHQRQERFGLPEGVYQEPWYEQLWWPFFKQKKSDTQTAGTVSTAIPMSMDSIETAILTADGRTIQVR